MFWRVDQTHIWNICMSPKNFKDLIFSVKKVLFDVLQNSKENTCARVSFLIKLQAEACNFIEK